MSFSRSIPLFYFCRLRKSVSRNSFSQFGTNIVVTPILSTRIRSHHLTTHIQHIKISRLNIFRLCHTINNLLVDHYALSAKFGKKIKQRFFSPNSIQSHKVIIFHEPLPLLFQQQMNEKCNCKSRAVSTGNLLQMMKFEQK